MDFETIYSQHPDTYQALVAHEDYQSNLAGALRRLLPDSGGDILDIGTGTGRVARQLVADGCGVTASDRSFPMLRTAAEMMPGEIAWLAADNRQLPFRPDCVDLVVAGWSLGHSVAWYPDRWPREIGRALDEMQRVVRPGGMLAVIETLGTGRETPLAPTQALADYYHWMEAEHGFDRQWMRTDYLFQDAAQAERLMRFFFGDEMGDRVGTAGVRLVPECTGLWTRRARATP